MAASAQVTTHGWPGISKTNTADTPLYTDFGLLRVPVDEEKGVLYFVAMIYIGRMQK